ncbi:hypothetical protein FACS189490_07320 [Clostridia bacterium]|nr:hypothetical protein FACS189490_07320 [Clostridia bacterium]
MHCSIHEQYEAAGMCVVCGKPFCEGCLVEVNGKLYCKEHVKVLINGEEPRHHEHSRVENGFHREGERRPDVIVNNFAYPAAVPISGKSRLAALVLCCLFGIAGFHRFYAGKIGTGLLWLFTGGLFGIGYIVDIIVIACGGFRDSYGAQIKLW